MPRAILLSSLLILGACAPRGELMLVPEARKVGTVESVYVAANRTASGQRREDVGFARLDVSIPPEREPGSLKMPHKDAKPDPRTDFLVSEYVNYARPEDFRAALSRAVAERPPGDRDVVLFIHGYNNTFAEGLYRFAQLDHDLDLPGVPVHYSWPSRGNSLAYVADRDSVLYSRDGLERSIEVATEASGGKAILVAHSMGASLLMESLRQMAIAGRRDVLDRIGAVVLLSPDIDVGVFRMQAKAIGRLPQPFVIFTSGNDRALKLSALISAEPARLGTLTDPRPLADLPVTLVDVGAFSTGDGHFNVATSPALMRILSQARELNGRFSGDIAAGVGPFTRTALRVERAAQIVISPGL